MAQPSATREIAQLTPAPGLLIFSIVWLGQVVSVLGSGITGFALGVWAYQRTGSVTLFALIAAFAVLPGIIASPFVGVLVDRWDRRRVMILSNVLSSLNILGIAGLLYVGRLEIWHIYLATMANSIFGAFHLPAFSASTTLLVPKAHYGRASGMVQLGSAISQIASPILAGLLVVSIQVWGALLVDFVTFVFAATTLLLVRIPRPPVSDTSGAERSSLLREASFGWRYIADRRGLLGLLVFFALTNFTVGIVQVLITPLVLSFATPMVLGHVLSVAGIGMLIGAGVMSIWGGPQRRVLGILGFTLMQGILLLMGGVQPNALLISATAALFLFCSMIVNGCSQALWLSKVAPDVQGRVFAIRTMVAWSSLPLAYIAAGPLADYVFEPLLAPDGPLAATIGQIIGVGAGRGIGLLFIVLGLLIMLAVIGGSAYPRLRLLEKEIPDTTPAVPSESALAAQGIAPLLPNKEEHVMEQGTSVSSLGNTSPEPGTSVSLLGSTPPEQVLKKERPSLSSGRYDTLFSLFSLLLLAFLVFLSLYRLAPPPVLPASAPATEFSAMRALDHLKVFAQRPHPNASVEHDRARDYLLDQMKALGLEAEIQEATPVFNLSTPFSTTFAGTSKVYNVVGRLKGTTPGRAILIAAHYDSVATGPGASDGGAAVATVLEVARALKASPALNNDVIFLLTDNEENLLQGSRAFVEQHPWASEVRVVLNLVARGTDGPSIMFETSRNNGWLIEEFAKSAPNPIASSVAYEVYDKLLPNDTDMTTFKEHGYAGLNFAYIDNYFHYHTRLDNIDNLNTASLQHHGNNALALIRHFGNMSLENVTRDNAIYFDLLGFILVQYPEAWAIPLMILVTLVFIGVMVLGFRRKRLTFSGMGLGMLTLLLAAAGTYGIIWLLWQGILAIHPEYRTMPQGMYNRNLYMVGFAALAIALTTALYTLFRKKVHIQNLTAGGLCVWLLVMWGSGTTLPGTSFLSTWPLLFSLAGLGFTFARDQQQQKPWQHFGVLSLSAVPGVILLIPIFYLMFIALPFASGIYIVILLVLLLGLLIPQISLMAKPLTWLLPATAALVGLGFLIAGSFTSGFDAQHPKPNSILYGFNADTGEASWLSRDRQVDEWTSQFFPNGFTRDPANDFFNFNPVNFIRAKAPATSVLLPTAVLRSDTRRNGVRALDIAITTPQQAKILVAIVAVEPGTVRGATVNGKPISVRPDAPWLTVISFGGSPTQNTGLDLTLETTSSRPVKLIVTNEIDGLPHFSGMSITPRPDTMMPTYLDEEIEDSTIVRKSFEF